jgi:hypothetical protein
VTVALDEGDLSADPSYMRCPNGHLWAEEAFPRLLGASMLHNMDTGHRSALAALQGLLDGERYAGRMKLLDGAQGHGEQLSCPECGATHGLAVDFDTHDISAAPSTAHCLNGHTWADARFPRWWGADIIRLAIGEDPDFVDKARSRDA